MADLAAKYQRWTRTDLLDRLNLLENELKRRNIDVDAELCAAAEAAEAEAAAKAAAAGSTEGGEGVPTKAKKAKRPTDIDPSRYSTRFIALKLAYLGKNYGGFEFQTSAELPTIEEELWKALVTARLIYPKDKAVIDFSCCDYAKCGRTDKGVSAFGQVVSLRVRSNRPLPKTSAAVESVAGDGEEAGEATLEETKEERPFDDIKDELNYTTLLNKLLPTDIRILAWCPSPPPGFSSRFSCRERQYRYFFTQPSFLPLPSQYNPVGSNGRLDIEAMRSAARLFVGVHDFRNFCKVDAAKQITNFEREIFDADVIEVPDARGNLPFLAGSAMRREGDDELPLPKTYAFVVKGSAFLWHQIRCMVSILFLVGQGLEPASIISDMLDVEKNPSRTTYIMAHDVPLVLWDCVFPEEDDPARKDALNWVYPSKECEGDYYGAMAVLDSSWTTWRERKIDEVLAAQLAGRIAGADPPEVWNAGAAAEQLAKGGPRKTKGKGRPVKPKVFEGGNNGRLIGSYVPVMKLKKMMTPEQVNDSYAKKMGFASAEEMRGTEGWRKAIKDARASKMAKAAEESSDA
jgi:tRNA pseudouridine38/39 synthase